MIVLFEILTDFKHIDEILSSKERGFFFIYQKHSRLVSLFLILNILINVRSSNLNYIHISPCSVRHSLGEAQVVVLWTPRSREPHFKSGVLKNWRHIWSLSIYIVTSHHTCH